MTDNEKKVVADMLHFLYKELVNEIDNHAGLQQSETVRLAEAIKASVKNTEQHFSI